MSGQVPAVSTFRYLLPHVFLDTPVGCTVKSCDLHLTPRDAKNTRHLGVWCQTAKSSKKAPTPAAMVQVRSSRVVDYVRNPAKNTRHLGVWCQTAHSSGKAVTSSVIVQVRSLRVVDYVRNPANNASHLGVPNYR